MKSRNCEGQPPWLLAPLSAHISQLTVSKQRAHCETKGWQSNDLAILTRQEDKIGKEREAGLMPIGGCSLTPPAADRLNLQQRTEQRELLNPSGRDLRKLAMMARLFMFNVPGAAAIP
ncbi:MAG: hypothetical protein ACODAD_00160 [Planctomycetota bacterium]